MLKDTVVNSSKKLFKEQNTKITRLLVHSAYLDKIMI